MAKGSKAPYWVQVLDCILGMKVSAGATVLATALARHSDPLGKSWPSFKTLQDLTGFTPKSVVKYSKELEAAGALVISRESGRQNIYSLVLDCFPTGSGSSRPDYFPTESSTEQSDYFPTDSGTTSQREVDYFPTDSGTTSQREAEHVPENCTMNSTMEHVPTPAPQASPDGSQNESVSDPESGTSEPPPEHVLQSLIDHFAAGWVEANHTSMKAFTAAKKGGHAAKTFKRLLESGEDPDTIRTMVDFFFQCQDPYYRRLAWDIKVFDQNYFGIKNQHKEFKIDGTTVHDRYFKSSGGRSRRPLR